jgi:exonuclease SbcC
MIRRIILENYMAHVRTVIEPAAGLTVLAGPNNCGKTSVVDAIETLCRNAIGDYMVRHETSEARVTLETDDGHVVRWSRRSGSVRYEIDGRVVHRVGRGVPDDLHEKLRLPAVEAGSESVEIHFGMQRSPVFLLDMSDGKKARFFASASDASYLLAMQRKHVSRVRARQAERRRLARERRRLDEALSVLDAADALTAAAAHAQAEFEALREDARSTASLSTLIDSLDAARGAAARCRAFDGTLCRLEAPPALEDAHGLAGSIGAIARERLVERLAAATAATLRALDAPPALALTEPLGALIAAAVTSRRAAARARVRSEHLSALPPLPGLDDLLPFEAMIRTIAALERNVAEQARTLAGLDADVGAVEAEIAAWAARNPQCPTCGAAVDAAHLLQACGESERRGDPDEGGGGA